MDPGSPSNAGGRILYTSIKHSDPERCVRLAQQPSVYAYYALKTKIEHSSAQWVQGFVELGGLRYLLKALLQLSGKGFTNFADAVLQLDCIACVRALMDSKVGIKLFVNDSTFINTLVEALDTPNTLPKKQLFEVMTAVCVYSRRGHHQLLEALEHLRKKMGQLHKFSLIVEELKLSETATYRTSLMALINSIIGTTEDLKTRTRLRDQFIGLKLPDLIQFIRRDERDADLAVQLEVFASAQHKDEEQMKQLHGGVDYLNHLELFHSIFTKVFGSPRATSFLHVLQDLYTLNTSSCDPSLLWQTMAQTTQHIASLQDKNETATFLQNLQKLTTTSQPSTSQVPQKAVPAQKRLFSHDLSGLGAGKIPQSPSEDGSSSSYDRRDSGISVWSNASPYDNFKRQGSGRESFLKKPGLERLEENQPLRVARPTKPTKPVNWVKIPANQANKPLSLWKQIRESSTKNLPLDWTALEGEFHDGSSLAMKNADDEVQLLSGDQSVALGIWLARLEATPEEMASCLLDADDSELSIEAIRQLKQTLPSHHEVSQLRGYQGSRLDLAPAEHLLLLLSDHADYRLLLDGLLFRAEFSAKLGHLKAALQALITACRDILHHPGLRDLVKTLLQAGNFLNANNHIGRAAGIRLDTWSRLAEVKGRHHHSNLLEFLLKEIGLMDDDVLLLVNDFPTLEAAAGHSVDQLKADVTRLNDQLKALLQQLSQEAGPQTRETFDLFIQDVKQNLEELHDSISRLRGLSHQVAQYFCEDTLTFDLKSCLTHLHNFLKLVRDSKKRGVLLRQEKQVADARKQQLDEHCHDNQMTTMFGKKAAMCSSFVAPPGDKMLTYILDEVHRGNLGYHDDDLITPDTEENPFCVSRIGHMTSSPMAQRVEDDSLDSFVFNEIRLQGSKSKTYVDRVETILHKQYHRDNQMQTASFCDPVRKEEHMLQRIKKPTIVIQNPAVVEPPAKRTPERRAPKAAFDDSPEIYQVKIYPKLHHDDRTPPHRPRPGHQRSNSDISSSRQAEDKWKNYEQKAAAAAAGSGKSASMGAGPVDSDNVVASLGLETRGQALDLLDVDILQEDDEDLPPQPFERKKKRASFFKRISRLVLRQRNSQEVTEPPVGPPGDRDHGDQATAGLKVQKPSKIEHAGVKAQKHAKTEHAAAAGKKAKTKRRTLEDNKENVVIFI